MQRLDRIEIAIDGLRRDMAVREEARVERRLRIDRVAGRVERIEPGIEWAWSQQSFTVGMRS